MMWQSIRLRNVPPWSGESCASRPDLLPIPTHACLGPAHASGLLEGEGLGGQLVEGEVHGVTLGWGVLASHHHFDRSVVQVDVCARHRTIHINGKSHY
jgi:hypothetical protein